MKKVTPILVVDAIEPCLAFWTERLGFAATADGPPDAHTTTVATTDGPVEATTAWRRDLRAGHTLEGPALVLEYSSTTWVPEGWTLEVDPWGSLLLKAAS